MTAVATEFLMLNPDQQILCSNSDWNRRRRSSPIVINIIICNACSDLILFVSRNVIMAIVDYLQYIYRVEVAELDL